MIDVKAAVQGAANLARRVENGREKALKAEDTAARVEGYRLYRKLQAEVRAGRAGGQQFQELSRIARHTKTGRLRANQNPLARTARLIRYNVDRGKGNERLSVTFGYIEQGNTRLTQPYKKILTEHQEGYDFLYQNVGRTELGRRFARIGGRLKKRGSADARFFFLRRSTGRAKVSARPIISPFWQANRAAALRRIRENFRRKMRGERI